MRNLLGLLVYFLIFALPVVIKYLYWKHKHRIVTYKVILVDIVYVIFMWCYIPIFISFIFMSAWWDINLAFFPENISPIFLQFIFLIIFLFPILVSLLYGYIYRKYFHQIIPYFSLEIFICFLVIPFFIFLVAGGILANYWR